MMPLTFLQPDSMARVTAVQGGRGATARLAAMGIYPGVVVTLKRCGAGGPVIVQAGGSRFGIGRGMARRIMVKPVD
ncbi:MAG: ferrous iron transport protein A [Candidatus Pacebacteria bacterium]|nr:ferrous iron transport protein A [Candidatus Paceibacterota bacterium]